MRGSRGWQILTDGETKRGRIKVKESELKRLINVHKIKLRMICLLLLKIMRKMNHKHPVDCTKNNSSSTVFKANFTKSKMCLKITLYIFWQAII